MLEVVQLILQHGKLLIWNRKWIKNTQLLKLDQLVCRHAIHQTDNHQASAFSYIFNKLFTEPPFRLFHQVTNIQFRNTFDEQDRMEAVEMRYKHFIFEVIICQMYRDSSIKKSQKSPNDKLLKSVYSKQKSKSEYSPNNHRSISKEQIKQQIKKVVYNSNPHHERPLAHRHYSEYRDPNNDSASQQPNSIRTSLTPKNFHYPKKTSEREVKTSKAADARGKELFVSTGRYGTDLATQQDLKQLFDRRREEEGREKSTHDKGHDKSAPHEKTSAHEKSSAHKRQPTSHNKYAQEETINIHQKNRQECSFNVRNYLTADQYGKFGDRFPENFKRVGLLGRGGFSVVWLGVHRSSKRKVAIKQILTKNPHETHLKEIWFGSYFFQKGGQAREQFENHVGINNICRLYSHEIRTLDSWLYYEVCEQSLGSCLFQLKGETLNGQRYYRIVYKQLIKRMAENQNQLKILMVEVSKALFLINSHNIVHSDLKTENILLRTKREEDTREVSFIRGVKLIDFGSSFLFTNLKQFSMATPQYMPPEILNYILFQNKLDYDQDMLRKMEKYKNPWTIDIWSLGCIVLEIVTGVPLWMSIQTKIDDKNMPRVTGLFAVKNRVFSKIIQKQIEVVNNLDYHLDHHNYSGIRVREDIRRVLKRMLDLNPEDRISPFEVLTHFGVNCEPLRIPSY